MADPFKSNEEKRPLVTWLFKLGELYYPVFMGNYNKPF